MSLLAPWVFALGIGLSGLVLALHFLTTRRPPATLLPTAQFVPVAEARAVSRASRPSDLLLLGLRILAVLLVSAACARPLVDAPGPTVRSVVLLDVSGAVADPAAARRIAAERLTEGGVLVTFAGTARESRLDSIGGAATGVAALSPALVVARRAAARIARGADSVRLVLVSPLLAAQFDAATTDLRRDWPGAIEVVRVPALRDSGGGVPRLVTPLADDPLAPAITALRSAAVRGGPGLADSRIVRGRAAPEDSAWGRTADRVLVEWPLSTGTARPDGVVVTGRAAAAVVAPLERLPLGADGVPVPHRVVARWRDGAVAVLETPLGDGCLRRVGVGVPIAGDLTLREPFRRLLAAVLAPCGGARGGLASDSSVAALADVSQPRAVPGPLLVTAAAQDTALAAALLAGALVLLLAEWGLRARGAR